MTAARATLLHWGDLDPFLSGPYARPAETPGNPFEVPQTCSGDLRFGRIIEVDDGGVARISENLASAGQRFVQSICMSGKELDQVRGLDGAGSRQLDVGLVGVQRITIDAAQPDADARITAVFGDGLLDDQVQCFAVDLGSRGAGGQDQQAGEMEVHASKVSTSTSNGKRVRLSFSGRERRLVRLGH